jgi:diacylglycerol kinase (ATP)
MCLPGSPTKSRSAEGTVVSGSNCEKRPDADQVLILVNPKAGRGPSANRLDQLAELLRGQRLAVELSGDLDRLCQRANQAFREGVLRALVSVGGDGTAAELVNRTDPGLPICLYPSGTANLLPRYLGLRADPVLVSNVIADGFHLKLDAGLANGRVFLMNASCGFDADVVHQVHRRRQEDSEGHLSYWSYAKPILAAIRSYQYPEIRVYWERAQADPEQPSPAPRIVRWAFAFNLPLYGWGLPLAPWADGTDGSLDVCTFQHGSLCSGLRYLAAAQGGWLRRLGDCEIGRATRLRITAEQPVAYQVDGDPGGWLPLEMQVLPRRLTFVVPRGHCLRA